jgi:hypothetical protein
MKHSLRFCLSAAALLVATVASAQTAPAPTTPAPAPAPAVATPPATADSQKLDIVEQDGQKYLLVSTLKGIHNNYEFQQNVQVVQNQRNHVVELNNRRTAAITTPEKEALGHLIETEAKQLDENNKKMYQAYGFTLSQQYWLQIYNSRVYSPITDEEYNKLPEADRNKPDFIINRSGRDKDGKTTPVRLKQVVVIEGRDKNDTLRNDAQQVQGLRQYIEQLGQRLKQVKSADDKKKLEEALKKAEEELQKKSDETLKAYGFNLSSPWALEVEESQLRIPVTDEQITKIKELQAKEAADKAAGVTTPASPAPAPTAR